MEPSSPKPHYVAVLEGSPRLQHQSVPILGSESVSPGPLDMANLRVEERAPSVRKELQDAKTTTTQGDYLPRCLQTFPHWWLLCRWQFSRSILTIDLRSLALHLEVVFGDLVFTIPMATILVITTCLLVFQFDVSRSGAPTTLALMIACVFAVRGDSLLLLLTKIPFKRARFYYQLFIFTAALLAGLHGWAHILTKDRHDEHNGSTFTMTGLVAFNGIVVCCLLSLVDSGQRYFGIFVGVQWLLLSIVVVFAVWHGAHAAVAGLVLGVIELFLRVAHQLQLKEYRSRSSETAQVSEDDSYANSIDVGRKFESIVSREMLLVCKLSSDIVLVEFPRVRVDTGEVFQYRAGQYALLCIPLISRVEWHPFTMSSSPDEDLVTFHIKAVGDWTRKLLELASLGDSESEPTFDLLVDGPHGGMPLDIYNPAVYSHIVLLSGGMGVTPMRSIANWLYYECYERERAGIERVHFVWSVKDWTTVEAIIAQEGYREQSMQPLGASISSLANSRGLLPESQGRPTHSHGQLTHSQSQLMQSRGRLTQSRERLTESRGWLTESRGIPTSSTDKFEFEFYVTQDRSTAQSITCQQLRDCLRYGVRPDMKKVMRSMGERAKQSGKSCVAVLVAGPAEMVADVTSAGLNLSVELGIRFNVYSEQLIF